jgi:hypothetical protein
VDPHETGAYSILPRSLLWRVLLRIVMFEWFATTAMGLSASTVLVGVLLNDWGFTAFSGAVAVVAWGFVVYDEARDRRAEREAGR